MKKTITSCCFTGYRPNKFPFELNQSNAEYIRFENKLTDAVFSLPDEGCHTFYCGMAMGFDIIAAETVLLLKKGIKNTEVRLICVIPFKGQEASFPPEWKERFNNILRNADEIIYLCEQYHKSCFQERNKYMIDNSDIVVTCIGKLKAPDVEFVDGPRFQTKEDYEEAVFYARSRGKIIIEYDGSY